MLTALLAGLLLCIAPGTPAPPIDAQDLDGGRVRLSDLRGRVVLVDFWATWCVPCRRSLPRYDALERRLTGRPFTLLAVSVNEERRDVADYVAKQGLGLRVVHDAGGRIVDGWAPPKMPTAYLIDARGNVRQVYAGYTAGTDERIEGDVLALLGEVAPSRRDPESHPLRVRRSPPETERAAGI